MIQEIASFVDPDPTVEFDPASRVSRHASLKCASLLSLSQVSLSVGGERSQQLSLSLSFSARNISLSLILSRIRPTIVLVHSTKTKEATGPAWSEKRRAGKKEEREKKEERISGQRGTERCRRDKERSEGRSEGARGEEEEEEDAAREKGRATRGATKVAVTLYKASKPNERGPKGKKTRRSALRGDAEGNGGVHEEEARMDGRRRWQGCKLEAVVPRRTTVRVSYSRPKLRGN